MIKSRYRDYIYERVLVVSMEEKIQVIKKNLTGDYDKDIEFLNSLYNQESQAIEDAKATINAINIVIEEVNNQEKNKIKENERIKEDKVESNDLKQEPKEQQEIDNMIDELFEHMEQESDDEALKSIENIIPKIEALTKSDENILYCSFKSELEKMLFTKIFAGEKEVRKTPYSNDTIYIIYADLLLKKKRKAAAMEALDRAIYWNFLSREARERKLDIYFSKKEIVKYLENVKLLQMISYTPQDIADCYNKYGYMFNELKDIKSAYAMYRLSYSYYINDSVANLIDAFEKLDPTLKDMSADDILNLAQDNDVLIGVNNKIVKAEREIASDLISDGLIDQAKILLENDYAMTNDEEIANIYNKLVELQKGENNANSEVEKDGDKSIQKKKGTEKASTKKSAVKNNTTKKKVTKKAAVNKEKVNIN